MWLTLRCKPVEKRPSPVHRDKLVQDPREQGLDGGGVSDECSSHLERWIMNNESWMITTPWVLWAGCHKRQSWCCSGSTPRSSRCSCPASRSPAPPPPSWRPGPWTQRPRWGTDRAWSMSDMDEYYNTNNVPLSWSYFLDKSFILKKILSFLVQESFSSQ